MLQDCNTVLWAYGRIQTSAIQTTQTRNKPKFKELKLRAYDIMTISR